MPGNTKRKRADGNAKSAGHVSSRAESSGAASAGQPPEASSSDEDVEEDEPWAGAAGGGTHDGGSVDDDDDDDDDDDEDGVDESELEFVNTEFDSAQATPEDFHGVRTLLRQVNHACVHAPRMQHQAARPPPLHLCPCP
jgi:hypothetical protein